MPENLMSDERHAQLLKAAEATVGLMNIGVDPNAALAKVAEDEELNTNEVDVVAHAVNNSRQLAHLQNSKGDDREGEFALIDPEQVKTYGDTQPPTNAEQDTGDRYGTQEEPGDNVEAKMDAPDAPEIQEDLSKAAAASCVENGDYRKTAETIDHAAILREGWGLDQGQTKVADHVDPVPFAKISHFRIGIEEASLQHTQAMQNCMDSMQKVAESMRRLDAPEWAEVEKIAAHLGADGDTLDLVFANCDIEKFGATRADLSVKTAGTLYASSKGHEIAQEIVRADTFWKAAADADAAKQILEQRYAEAESALFPKEAAGGSAAAASLPLDANISINPGEFAEPLKTMDKDYTGVSEELLQDAIGGGPKAESFTPSVDPNLRQELREIDTQGRIRNIMETDSVISGYSVPEVVDAYNAAMSVNPQFGDAELVSYMKQHLATGGAMPAEMQARLRAKAAPGEEEEID